MSEQVCFAPLGYSDVPPGKLANVATFLETFERPALRPEPAGLALRLAHLSNADAGTYRSLIRLVGQPYLWSSRLEISDEELLSIIHDENVAVYALRDAEGDAGMLELDFRTPGECEVKFFGVVSRHVGTGAARWLMNRAIELAWLRPIERFWVHTCSLDHPNALPFYMRSGFVPYKRMIEVYDDPRLIGLLPLDCAPDVPVL